MKEFIISNLATENYITFGNIMFKLIMALLIGLAIYVAYYYSTAKVTYNSNFAFSLVSMTIITTAIMAVISSNIALSLGMIGALSILRFRTAVKDPKDIMFIFWAIMAGISCGVSQYIIALTCTIVLFIFFLIIKAFKEEKRYVLIIRCESKISEQVKALTYSTYPNSILTVQNTAKGSTEFIYEIKKFKDLGTEEYLKSLNELGEIECANFILQEEKTNV